MPEWNKLNRLQKKSQQVSELRTCASERQKRQTLRPEKKDEESMKSQMDMEM